MDILVLHGSNRIGNTYTITKNLMYHLKEQGSLINEPIEFDEVFLKDLDGSYCTSCNKCFGFGEGYCPHSEVYGDILDKLAICDGFIITSPVYSLNVSAIIKNFIDHFSFLINRPGFYTKKALVITSSYDEGASRVANYISDTIKKWGVNKVFTLSMTLYNYDYNTVTERDESIIKKMSKIYFNDVESGKIHSPSIKDIYFYNVSRAKAISKISPFDYFYWSESGLLNRTHFYKLNFILNIIGKIIFSYYVKVIKKRNTIT